MTMTFSMKNLSNIKHKSLITLAAGVTLTLGLMACSDKIEAPSEDTQTQNFTYQIESVVSTSDQAVGAGTRSLEEDATSLVNSLWHQGDTLMLFNLSDGNKSTAEQYNFLKSGSKGKEANFNGSIVSLNPLKMSDELCFFYPGGASTDTLLVRPTEYGSYTIKDDDGEKRTVKGYMPQTTIKSTVEVNLQRQDGTIATIGKKFDYQWASAKPKAIKGKRVSVEVGKLKRLVAFWGLRFADQNKQILTDIDSVLIANVTSVDILDLEKGKYVGTDEDRSYGLKLVPNKTMGKLSSQGGKYTYAAVLPGKYSEVTIIVFVGKQMYEQTLATCEFKENGVYRDDIIKLKPVDPNAGFVDVQGVKWATGNFIHYETPAAGEYWGIAPTQWWIADYACDNTLQNRSPGSQFTKSYSKREEDQDVFGFGYITDALYNGSHYFSGTAKDIAMRFWKGYTELSGETTDKSKATTGDLPYFHTMDHRHVYRLPRYEEVKKIIDKSHAYPAYCYTDKGNKVYGAYFYTCRPGTTRILGFPTGARRLYKYNDVTALVRAQKGLFLPITGKRNVGSSVIGFRDMAYAGAYAQYMTSYSVLSGTNRCLYFGPTVSLHYGPGVASQGIAIRPVLERVDESKEQEPEYGPFKGLE